MGIDFKTSLVNKWVRDSRLMFLHFPPILVHQQLHEIYSDMSNEVWENKDYQTLYKEDTKKPLDPTLDKFKGKINIVDVANKYNLNVKKGLVICPFHKDTAPSLSLSKEKNVFYCFGCHAKGDIITFIRMMEDLNENNKK